MGVTLERSLGVAVLGLIAGEVPDDQSLVSAGREEHVGATVSQSVSSRCISNRGMAVLDVLLHRGGQAGDPAILQTFVSIQSTRSGFHFGAREGGIDVPMSTPMPPPTATRRKEGVNVRGPRECP